MRIGITFDLKVDSASRACASGSEVQAREAVPDDFQEEYDSPATIESLASVLRGLGHEVVKLSDGRELLERLLADPPDFVFNLAEGQGVSRSREARVPAVLEMLGIPYSGSDPLTLAVTLDKDCARRLVASAGVPVPPGVVLEPDSRRTALQSRLNGSGEPSYVLNGSGEPSYVLNGSGEPSYVLNGSGEPSYVADALAGRIEEAAIPFPAIVKPAWEGSSKGIRNRCLVHDRAELRAVVESLWRDHRQPLLVEEFIVGDELTVGILGNEPPHIFGVMRVVPNRPTAHFVYSLEVKRDFRRQVTYECPAQLSPAATAAVERAALTAHRALGCRDVSRVDFRLRGDVPYFLEVNPLPGLSPDSSDLVLMAEQLRWSYPQLVEAILTAALERHARTTRPIHPA